jgi:hypothetical protein
MSTENHFLSTREENQLPVRQCIPANHFYAWECQKLPLNESFACGAKMHCDEIACTNSRCRKTRGKGDFALNREGKRIGRLADQDYFRRWPEDKQGRQATRVFSEEKEATMLEAMGMSRNARGGICGQDGANIVRWVPQMRVPVPRKEVAKGEGVQEGEVSETKQGKQPAP